MRILELLMRETLPQRNYFRASEVSDLLMIKPHEMRYWESEFPQIRPQKTKTGQRIYRRQDVIIFSAIKHLLLEKKLSLASAQRIIAESDDLFSTPAAKFDDVMPEESASPVALEQHNETNTLPVTAAPCVDNPALTLDVELLQEAADLLDGDCADFDEVTQQIYQSCGDELLAESASDNVPEIDSGVVTIMREPIFTSPMMPSRPKESYEKTLATLRESRASLNEILGMLDKFHESKFWESFKH